MPKHKIAFFDIDGTIRNKSLTESLFEILVQDYPYRGANEEKYLQLQDEASKLRKSYKSSGYEADDLFGKYCQKVVEFSMFALEKYSLEEVREIGRRIATEYRDHQDYIFSKELIKFLRQEGFELVAISGSPNFLVDAFVKEYGFSKGIGQEYIKDESAGIVKETEIRTFQNKHIFVEELLKQRTSGEFHRSDFFIIAVGDTECDFSMMDYADKTFVINPSLSFFSSIINFVWNNSPELCKLKYSKFTIISERKRRPIVQELYSTKDINGCFIEYGVEVSTPLIRKIQDVRFFLEYRKSLWF